MPRIGREPPNRLFRGREFTRLTSMIFMLIVLFMLMQRAKAPETWRWLVGKSDGKTQVIGREKKTSPETTRTPAHVASDKDAKGRSQRNDSDMLLAQAPAAESSNAAKPADSKPAESKPADAKSDTGNRESPDSLGETTAPDKPDDVVKQKLPPATGPTDEDPDEAGGAAEDFDAINDRSVTIDTTEMSAYERIVRWVLNQPMARLEARANHKNPSYGKFIESPSESRELGKIYEFDVNIRRILKYDKPLKFYNSEDDPHEPVQLYEMWGSTEGSVGNLYELIVDDPPDGMPIGSLVDEDVRFVGYFYKLQGYRTARGQKIAPALIGRVIWMKRPVDVTVKASERLWVVLAGGAALLGVVVWGTWLMFGKRKHSVAPVSTEMSVPPSITIDEWLDHAQSDEQDQEREPDEGQSRDEDLESHDDDANGHSKRPGSKDLFPDGGPHLLN